MKIYKNTVCHKCLLYRGRCIIGAPLLYHGTVAVHTRALISGPASVARCATGDASVLRQKLRSTRKFMPENQVVTKVRLNASRTSKRSVSGCLRMSWRKELFWFICNSAYYRLSLRGASQNKIDDDGEYEQHRIKNHQRRQNVNKSLYLFGFAYGKHWIPKSAFFYFSATSNRKRCLKKE